MFCARHESNGLWAIAYVNLFLADGEAAGQEVFHVHLHVFPRYKGDGFGFKFPPGYSNKPERSELDAIALQIKEALTRLNANA